MEQLNGNEPPEMTPEEFLSEQKRRIRQRSLWSVGIGALVITVNVALAIFALNSPEIVEQYELQDATLIGLLMRSIVFLLGVFFLFAGIWGLYEAKRLKFEDFVPNAETVEFFRAAEGVSHYYTYIIIGAMAAVYVAEMSAGSDENGLRAIGLAGLVKTSVVAGHEYWRILTAGVLHGGLLHIYFNSQALFGIGSLVEIVADRARMTIVFLLSIIGGGLLSLANYNDQVSVGASGGILGLLGYLVIYGYRRKHQLPKDFLRSLLVNVLFIAALGVVGYKIIDNFAHFGGFATGAVYGLVTIPRDPAADPRKIGAFTDGAGLVALGVYVFIAVLTVLILTGQIVL